MSGFFEGCRYLLVRTYHGIGQVPRTPIGIIRQGRRQVAMGVTVLSRVRQPGNSPAGGPAWLYIRGLSHPAYHD